MATASYEHPGGALVPNRGSGPHLDGFSVLMLYSLIAPYIAPLQGDCAPPPASNRPSVAMGNATWSVFLVNVS